MNGDGNERSNGSNERGGNGKVAKETLRDDLTRVLRYEFNFKGKYAFSMSLPHHPNPCIHIDGIGIVGLPLGGHEADLIATAGSPTDEGAVHGAILIDNSKVSFRNPKWGPYIDEVVREHVWESLGCAPHKTAPRCEFHKLLLQTPGTHFFSPKDAETPPGTFATIIIVLPSEFKGGDIRASHGDGSTTLESATGSLYETTLLAWYTSIGYRAEDLTSGCRLALVYSLVHTSADTPLPCIPSEDTLVDRAREVFRKWTSSNYEGIPDDHVAVYVPDEGDHVKGDDALSVLKAAADAENMALLLGTLCAHVTGWGEASTSEKPPYGLSQGTFESPVMERLYRVKFKVKKLTDIKDKPTHNKFRLILDEGNLVPEFPFSGVEPDQQHSRPFTGHDDSPLEYWYERPALVLFPNSKQLDILLASGGIEYAITELEKSALEGPTNENQKIVEYIFRNWGKTPPEYYLFDFRSSYEVPTVLPSEVAAKLVDIAVYSGDAKLWVRTIGMCKFKDGVDLSRFGRNRVVAAWEKFQLEEIETALDHIVDCLEGTGATLEMLQELGSSDKFSHHETRKDQWLSKNVDLSFSKEPEWGELPLIMEVASSKGLHYIAQLVMPSFLSRSLDSLFWTTFVEGLEMSKGQLLAQPPSQKQTLSNQALFDGVLEDVQRAIALNPWRRLTSTTLSDSEDEQQWSPHASDSGL